MTDPIVILVGKYLPLVTDKRVMLDIPIPADVNKAVIVEDAFKRSLSQGFDISKVSFRLTYSLFSFDLSITFLGQRTFSVYPASDTWLSSNRSFESRPIKVSQIKLQPGNGTISITGKEPSAVVLEFEYRLYSNALNPQEDEQRITGITLTVPYLSKSDPGESPKPKSLLSVDTRIFILSATEPVYGQNITQALFRSVTGEWRHRPKLTSVVKGCACTLIGKYSTPTLELASPVNLEMYGLLRYFLWFLIGGKWDITILVQSRTEEFFLALRNSPYRVWLATFAEPRYKGYDR